MWNRDGKAEAGLLKREESTPCREKTAYLLFAVPWGDQWEYGLSWKSWGQEKWGEKEELETGEAGRGRMMSTVTSKQNDI